MTRLQIKYNFYLNIIIFTSPGNVAFIIKPDELEKNVLNLQYFEYQVDNLNFEMIDFKTKLIEIQYQGEIVNERNFVHFLILIF